MPSLTPLLSPHSVAVVGASDDPTRIGGRPIAYMLARKFRGSILPVNPNRATVQGLTAYPSPEKLPEAPDVAIVAVPAASVAGALEALGRRGAKSAIVFSAGFAETGEIAMQAELAEIARRHGMRMIGPNCLGLFNDRIGFYGTFSSSLEGGGFSAPGPVGIASQSGAFGTHVFAAARAENIGAPVCVTTGNEADVSVADVIEWFAQDQDTHVVAAYVEGVRDAARFSMALEAARLAKKPVVVMKVGRSRLGAAAARLHTASDAGDDEAFDAMLQDSGAVRARSTEEMLDVVRLAARRVYPARNTLGVLTISGGAGVLVSDAADALGLPMPPMPAAAQARLRELVAFASPGNPVDCTAQALNDLSLAAAFMQAMTADGGYASVLAFFSQVAAAPSIAQRLRAQLSEVRRLHPDRLYVLSALLPPALAAEWEADGFSVFADPTRATVAIHAMGVFGAAFERGGE